MTHHRLLGTYISDATTGRYVATVLNDRAGRGISFTCESTSNNDCHCIALHVEGYRPLIQDYVDYWTGECDKVVEQYHESTAKWVDIDHRRGIE